MLREFRAFALSCSFFVAVSTLSSGAIAQTPGVAFPFAVCGVDDASGEIGLTPRADEIAQLSQFERVHMTGVPLADGTRIDLELSRIDLSLRQFGVEVDGSPATEVLDELDLSLWTTGEYGGEHGGEHGADEAMLSFSNYGCRGWIRHASVLHHLIPSPDENGDWSRSRALLIQESALAQRGVTPSASCATGSFAPVAAPSAVGAPVGLAATSSASLYRASVALETDYQLFTVFGSVPAEVAYLTTLYSWVSLRFEEQVGVVLTYPYLQIYTTPADPWSTQDTPGLTCIDMIYEFQAAWQGAIPAGAELGHFISGANLGCGAGFIGGLCGPPRNFSVMSLVNGTTPFPIAPGPANWDFTWICHEIGHNFNAIHTHDYCPPLDSCPPAGYFGVCQTQQACTNQGTLMSYCHACPGGMSNFTTWFHTQSAADMRAWVVASNCLPLYCDDPVVYCVAKVNSLGCLPSVTSDGHPTLSGLDDFVVRASNVLSSRNGVYFYGFAPHNAPFQGGVLCVAPPLRRTPTQNSGGAAGANDCTGVYSYTWTHARLSTVGAGATLYSQFWSRDPASASTTGLTDAVSFTICN